MQILGPSLALLCSGQLLFATAVAAAPSPVEGYWLGEVVMERQPYPVGFEFTRTSDDHLSGRQWFAALHLFGSPIGEIAVEADHYRNAQLGLDLVLADDGLTGTLNGSQPVRLRRSEPLLTTPPTPVFPTGPAPVWTYRAGAALWATPAVEGDLVCVGDEKGQLHALRLADAKPVWTFDSGAPIYGTALIAGDAVFVLNDAGRLARLDRGTGAVRWQQDIGGSAVVRHLPAATEYSYDFVGPQPVLADGLLYLPAGDGAVVAIDAATGETRWRVVVGGLIRNTPLVTADRIVVGDWAGRITALARTDGAKLWQVETGAPITAAPVRLGHEVLASSRNSKLYRLSLAEGRTTWERFHAGSWVESAPRVDGDEIFIGSSDLRTVRSLDPATGQDRWSTDVLGWTWGTPAVAGDTVFAGSAGATGYPISQDGGMVALDRHTGAPKWRVTLPALAERFITGIVGSPVVAGNLVLFASQDGVLYALPAQTGSDAGK